MVTQCSLPLDTVIVHPAMHIIGGKEWFQSVSMIEKVRNALFIGTKVSLYAIKRIIIINNHEMTDRNYNIYVLTMHQGCILNIDFYCSLSTNYSQTDVDRSMFLLNHLFPELHYESQNDTNVILANCSKQNETGGCSFYSILDLRDIIRNGAAPESRSEQELVDIQSTIVLELFYVIEVLRIPQTIEKDDKFSLTDAEAVEEAPKFSVVVPLIGKSKNELAKGVNTVEPVVCITTNGAYTSEEAELDDFIDARVYLNPVSSSSESLQNWNEGAMLTSDNFDSIFSSLHGFLPKVWVISSYVASCWKSIEAMAASEVVAKKVEKVKSRLNLREKPEKVYSVIFVPSSGRYTIIGHWQMIEIDLLKKTVSHYCSLNWPLNYQNEDLQILFGFVECYAETPLASFSVASLPCPIQPNGIDCGVYAMINLLMKMKSHPLNYTHERVRNGRIVLKELQQECISVGETLKRIMTAPTIFPQVLVPKLLVKQKERQKMLVETPLTEFESGSDYMTDDRMSSTEEDSLASELEKEFFTGFSALEEVAEKFNLLPNMDPFEVKQNSVVTAEKVGLEEFINVLSQLDLQARTRIIVEGRDNSDEVLKRLSWDTPDSCKDLRVVHDVDSIMFTTHSTTFVISDLYLFRIGNRALTITSNNHFESKIDGVATPLYQIPNTQLGSLGLNSCFKLHIFFPRLRRFKNGRWVNFMTSKQSQILYDYAIYPAANHCLPRDVSPLFPLSFQHEEAKSRTKGGQYFIKQTIVPGVSVNAFLGNMKQRIDSTTELEDYRDFLFHVHAKNLKIPLRSTISNIDFTLNPEYRTFCWTDIKDIWVDLGVEVFPNTAQYLVWKRDFVENYLKTLMGLKGTFNPFCLSYDIGGGTSEAGKSAINGKLVKYVQLYMVGKNTDHHYTDIGFKSFSAANVMNRSSGYINSILNLEEGWKKSVEFGYGVRVEWRIPHSAISIAVPAQTDSWLVYLMKNQAFSTVDTVLLVRYKSIYVEAFDNLSQIFSKEKGANAWKGDIIASYVRYVIRAIISRPDPVDFTAFERLFRFKTNLILYNRSFTDLIDISAKTIRIDQIAAHKDLARFTKKKQFLKDGTGSRVRIPSVVTMLNPKQPKNETKIPHVETVDDMFKLFLSSLWDCIPGSAGDVSECVIGSLPLTIKQVKKSVVNHHFISKNSRSARFTERFKWFFPLPGDNIEHFEKCQGWKSMNQFLNAYLIWRDTNAMNEADYNELRNRFLSLECLPSGGIRDKLWVTRQVKGKDGTFVYFVTEK